MKRKYQNLFLRSGSYLLLNDNWMGKIYKITLLGMLVLGLFSGRLYAQDSPDLDPQPQKGKSISNPEFQGQLMMVYETYINLKNAFVASDAGRVKENAKMVASQVENVGMNSLEGQARTDWMNQSKSMKESLKAMQNTGDISNQRIAFSDMSNALYFSIKEFGISGMNVYHQYCPMALNNKGAYWLSNEKKIQNPYFGDMMMSCGSTKETLN
jgi:membrane fusion protein, copper/silver efflux system